MRIVFYWNEINLLLERCSQERLVNVKKMMGCFGEVFSLKILLFRHNGGWAEKAGKVA